MTSSRTAHRSPKKTNAYDDWIGRMIPGYDVMHRLVDHCLSAELPRRARVLMVGAGTGAEVIECGTHHPGWTITAVEPDATMSELGRQKIATQELTRRVRWHEGQLPTLQASAPFDGATIIIVLQFLSDERKLELLRQIGLRLKPGAPLLLATFVGDAAAAHTENAYDLMTSWAIAQGIDREQAAKRLSHRRKDVHLVTEGKLNALLRKAGYVDPQRIYQALPVQVWQVRRTR